MDSYIQKAVAEVPQLIGVFVTVTTPVTLMMLGRAALYRDRSELNPGVPPQGDTDGAARRENETIDEQA